MDNLANNSTLHQGFLLTRQSYDRLGKANIDLWLATPKGPARLNIPTEQPIFFVHENDLQRIELILKSLRNNYSQKKLKLSTFTHQRISGVYFRNLRSFFDARSLLTDAGINFYEANIRLEERYLMERFVYGGVEFMGQQSSFSDQTKKKFDDYHEVKIKSSDYVPDLKIVSLDIECSEKGELYSIGFYSGKKQQGNHRTFKRVIMIQPDPLTKQQSATDYVLWVKNEVSLLQALEQTIQHIDPDIIIGWNIINFDFRLLIKRAAEYNLKLRLGRDQSGVRWRDSRTEKFQGFVSIAGRVVIDGIAALKAEAYSFPSFSLEAIAQHFLGRGKKTDDVENRLDAIIHDFRFNKLKLADYNLQDCILVWDIFEKIKLMDYLVFRSQLTGLELDRAGGSVAAFVNLYLPKLHRQGYVSPNLPEGGGLASPGGYVMKSKPGLYKNVLVLDFKSLYPSIIRTFKIDPMGLIEGLRSPDNAIPGFRGGCFSKEEHILPEIITELWKQRDQAKTDDDKARSQALKIIMNSFYGVLGSGGCPFFDTRLASSITLRGHEIMQQTAHWIQDQGLDVIYGDTDSTFVLLNESLSAREANAMGKSLAETINRKWQIKLTEDYQIECFLEIEFESHFSKFLMPTIRGAEQGSKKRYAGLLKNGEQEKLIFKGLENVRTDWTVLARDFQLQLYQMIFHGEDPTDFIHETVRQTLAGERDTDLIYRKRLRRNLHSYVKNVPPHVKAARLADEENRKSGRPLKYQNKGWISYLMTVNGPQPLDYLSAGIDHQFYVDRQLEPVADGILPFIGLSFRSIVDLQMGLF